MLAVLLVTAVSCRLYLTHGIEYYGSLWETEQMASESGESMECNCPICHAEDFLAVAAENFNYTPIISEVEFEQGVLHTAAANNIVVVSSLRGPPYLS